MVRELLFREMTTAPKDGTPIEVRHGPIQEIALASWSEQNQAWIRANDPSPKTLQSVRVWRPAPKPQNIG
jgi:hypothetical protein